MNVSAGNLRVPSVSSTNPWRRSSGSEVGQRDGGLKFAARARARVVLGAPGGADDVGLAAGVFGGIVKEEWCGLSGLRWTDSWFGEKLTLLKRW